MIRDGVVRAGWVRRLAVAAALLAAGMASAVVPGAALPAGAESFSATASVTPREQALGDPLSGAYFTFTVRNTGTKDSIGSVEIARASTLQTVGLCPNFPGGWTVEWTAARCRYSSQPGTADDIAPGQSAEFVVLTTTGLGSQDSSGTWSVKVSRKRTFDDLKTAAAEPPGLALTLRSLLIQGVAVDPQGDTTPGGPCPPVTSRPLLPGSGGHTVVICGRNGTRSAVTPTAARSSLSGSLLTSPGTFESAPVPPGTDFIVLGRWTGAVATTQVSPDHTLNAVVGVDARRTALAYTFGTYSVFNTPPSTVAAEVFVAEGTAADIGLVATDPETQQLAFSIASPPQHGSLGPIVPTGCAGTQPVTCRATVRYTPDPGYSGAESFAYRANDGLVDGPPAVASLEVYHPSDPPVNGFAIRFGGPEDDVARALAIDGEGNTIVTGTFSATVDLDPGPGVWSATSVGLSDIFLAKYNPSGQLLWARTFGTTSDDGASDVAVDAAGNIAITGATNASIDLGGGPLTHGRFGGDGLVGVYGPDGAHRWSSAWGDQGPNSGQSVAFDLEGNLLLGGFFTGEIDFDPGPGVTTFFGGFSGFVAKYTSAGSLLWVGHHFGQGVPGLDVGPAGEVVAAGLYRATADFDAGPGVALLTTTSNLGDAYVLKLDAAGAVVWARGVGAFFPDAANDVAVDGNGDVVVDGFFQRTVDFDPGPGTALRTSEAPLGTSSMFLLKLTAAGDFAWVTTLLNGTGAVDVDTGGNPVITGSFQGTMDFDPGPGTTTLRAFGVWDTLVASYDGSTGGLRWAGAMGGPGVDGGSDVAIAADGSIRVLGAEVDTSDLDPGPSVYDMAGLGLTDMFLVELDAQGQLS